MPPTDLRVSFPTPPSPPRAGAMVQEFRLLVRRKEVTPPATNPVVTVELWESGVLRAVLDPFTVTISNGEAFSVAWDAASLVTTSGANVQCRAYSAGTTGGTVEFGAVEWNYVASLAGGVSGGSVATTLVIATGAGTKKTSGGAAAIVRAIVTGAGAGSNPRSGGSVIQVPIRVYGGGVAPAPPGVIVPAPPASPPLRTPPRVLTFEEALRAPSHTVVIRVDILEGGRIIRSTGDVVVGSGTSGDPLAVASGSVQVQARGDIRRSGTIEIVDPTGALTPIAAFDLLDPLAGREFRIWRGLLLAEGLAELKPVATLTIETADVSESAEGITVTLGGRDRAAAVAENVWQGPYSIVAGFSSTAACLAIVWDRLPHLLPPSNLEPSTATVEDLNLGTGNQRNPWADIEKIAEGASMTAFFDPMGNFVMRAITDPTTRPVVRRHLLDGTGLRLSSEPVTRRVDRASLRNGVIVRSSAPWLLFPIEGQAWDTDRSSNTYSGMVPDGLGGYEEDPTAPAWARPRPEILSDPMVYSAAAATDLAVAKLSEVRGIEEVIEYSTIVDPTLEVGDVIEVEAESLGGVALLPLDSFDVPLGVDEAQRCSAKRRRR